MGKPMKIEEVPLGAGNHWRLFYDSSVLRWWHMPDKDITMVIEKINGLEGKVGRQSKRQLMARFKGAKLPFALNATNCVTIEQLYGADPHGWAGNAITLYVTTTEMEGKTVQCIRVRPTRPKPRTAAGGAPEPKLNEDAPAPSTETNPNPDEDGR